MTRNIVEASLPYAGIALVLLVVFHLVFNRLTPYDDRKVWKLKVKAARITRAGAYLGYLTAVLGSLVMSKQPYKTDLMMFALDGAVALVVYAVAYYMTDFAILRNVNNAGEIERGNAAVAKVEFCAYLALGVIMNASFAGGGDTSVLSGLLSATLFSFIGLATVMAIYTVYTVGWALRGCSLDGQVRQGNQAAAVEAGSLLLAMSAALWFSIVGNFTGWMNDIKTYAIAAAYSVAAVGVGRSLTGVVLSHSMGRTRQGEHHGNMAKARIVGVVSIACGIAAGLYVFYA